MSELTGKDISQGITKSNQLKDQLDKNNGQLDVSSLYQGAQREADERAERQRKLREKELEAQAKRDKEINDLLAKAGETVRKEKEEKAALETKKETEKAQAELEAKIRKENGLQSAEEEERSNAFSKMLGNLKL